MSELVDDKRNYLIKGMKIFHTKEETFGVCLNEIKFNEKTNTYYIELYCLKSLNEYNEDIEKVKNNQYKDDKEKYKLNSYSKHTVYWVNPIEVFTKGKNKNLKLFDDFNCFTNKYIDYTDVFYDIILKDAIKRGIIKE